MKNCKDFALIGCLCKDIARHASQLEAESQGLKQSTDRYLELKKILMQYSLYGDGSFEDILKEIRKSTYYASLAKGEERIELYGHLFCMLEYFLMLFTEIVKEEN